ncbi:MAG: aminodeoxychorismate synthase component I, partial [Aldersonia sp.]|nr:aminodeoxychorismate synthase component I [Aldersonia sp.]
METSVVRTLLIDNYDSFTYNLADLLTAVNEMPPTVVTNDVAWEALDFARFDNVVISPGPGDPTVTDDFGIAARVF